MSRVATSVRRFSTFFKQKKALDVLDYGTGTMRNALFMADRGFRVYAADLPLQVEKLRNCPANRHVERLLSTNELEDSRLNVDLVLSTYVFNIIMDKDERCSYLQTAVSNLKPGGYLLMEVRCRMPGDSCGTNCPDFFSSDECAKALTHEELDILLAPYGLRRISHYYSSHAVAAIYQRLSSPMK